MWEEINLPTLQKLFYFTEKKNSPVDTLSTREFYFNAGQEWIR